MLKNPTKRLLYDHSKKEKKSLPTQSSLFVKEWRKQRYKE